MIDIFKYNAFNNMINKSNFEHTLKHKCLTLKNFNYCKFKTLKYPQLSWFIIPSNQIGPNTFLYGLNY